ncbi:MAG: tetratricopeptide repeat protein [Flavobacteriales bacterium]|nr:tetratricopeptide repeat protein [Flavobacteriales bacterium]
MPSLRFQKLFLSASLLIGLSLVSDANAQSAQLLLVRADSLMDAGKPQRALDVFEQAIKKEPSVKTYLGRARAWYTLERMDRFALDVDKALQIDSTSAEAHYQRALYSLRANDSDRTVFHAGRAIHFATTDRLKAKAHLIRGEALADDGNPGPALADFEAGRQLGVEDPIPMRMQARLYDAQDRHADALAILERLCELEPNDIGHWTNRGFELLMLERYDEAMPMIERALEYDKDEPVALSNRAYVNMMRNKNDEAWADVERSIRNFPSNPYALRTRAMLRLRRGDRVKACEDLGLSKALGDVPGVDELIRDNCAGLPQR